MTRLAHFSFVIAIMAFSLDLFAAPADLPNYYSADFVSKLESGQLKDDALKSALKNILAKIHIKSDTRDVISDSCPSGATCEAQITTHTYKEARQIMFGQLQLRSNSNGYFLEDVYCHHIIDETDGVGRNQIPDHKQVNCEHTWPQSRFNPNENKNAQLTDLHHLFPVDSRANSSRGNHIFADVDGREVNSECSASHRGRALGSSETAFEPPAQHKGDVARALFYFSTRYNNPIGSLEESFLRRWNWEDPVDDVERSRNEKVYAAQKNRNPYIDDPELVDLVRDF